MFRFLVVALLTIGSAFAQTTCPNTSPAGTIFNVVQPFHFFFDQVTAFIGLVDHYQIIVTPTQPAGPAKTYNIGIPTSAPSVSPGCTTYSVLADSTLPVANYTYSAVSCSATTCLSPTSSVIFIINTPPPPTPVNPGNLQAK